MEKITNFDKNTLAVNINDGLFLDLDFAKEYGKKLHETYVNADPFPHVVVDNFLPQDLILKIVDNFPARPVKDEQLFELGNIGHHKRQIPPYSCNGFNRDVFAFFNSAPILKFLENLTGIKGLLPDPFFSGGGFHEISRGGMLGIHADFRLNKSLNLHRRINMLIYLNDNWQDEWGGELELWDKAMQEKVVSIFPILNRCAIFSTNEDSYHGHPDPLNCPERITRKSIALYYYTASENISLEVPNNPTVYVERPVNKISQKQQPLTLKLDLFLLKILPPKLYRLISRFRLTLRNLLNGIYK